MFVNHGFLCEIIAKPRRGCVKSLTGSTGLRPQLHVIVASRIEKHGLPRGVSEGLRESVFYVSPSKIAEQEVGA